VAAAKVTLQDTAVSGTAQFRQRRGYAAPLTDNGERTALPEQPTNASAEGARPEREAKRARD
jgi:hypothetical protein